MSNQRSRLRSPGIIATWLLAVLIGLPILYVVSFGPACWAVRAGFLCPLPVVKFYSPLVEAAWASAREESVISRALAAYTELYHANYVPPSPDTMGSQSTLFTLKWAQNLEADN
jgi:hypothetical protein